MAARSLQVRVAQLVRAVRPWRLRRLAWTTSSARRAARSGFYCWSFCSFYSFYFSSLFFIVKVLFTVMPVMAVLVVLDVVLEVTLSTHLSGGGVQRAGDGTIGCFARPCPGAGTATS